MKTAEMSMPELKNLYANSNQTMQTWLEEKYGAETFKKSDDKMASWEGMCELAKIDPVKSLPYPEPKDGEERSLNAFKKAMVYVRLRKAGKKCNWSGNSYNYYPWMKMSGSGPSFDDYDGTYACSFVGSRLCSLDREHVHFFAEHYPDVLYDMFSEED